MYNQLHTTIIWLNLVATTSEILWGSCPIPIHNLHTWYRTARCHVISNLWIMDLWFETLCIFVSDDGVEAIKCITVWTNLLAQTFVFCEYFFSETEKTSVLHTVTWSPVTNCIASGAMNGFCVNDPHGNYFLWKTVWLKLYVLICPTFSDPRNWRWQSTSKVSFSARRWSTLTWSCTVHNL
jgi:hypothetical protein